MFCGDNERRGWQEVRVRNNTSEVVKKVSIPGELIAPRGKGEAGKEKGMRRALIIRSQVRPVFLGRRKVSGAKK